MLTKEMTMRKGSAGEQRLKEAETAVRQLRLALLRLFEEKACKIEQEVEEMLSSCKGRAERLRQEVEEQIRQEPVKSVLWACAAGLAVGYLLSDDM